MLILNAQELESQGIPYRAASRILFQERLFVKGQSFSQRVKQVAINLYEEYLNSGIHCLLVESAEQITFWRELETSSPDPVHPGRIGAAVPQIKRDSPAASQQAIELDDVIRIEMQYRGTAHASDPTRSTAQNQTASTTANLQVRYRRAVVNIDQPEVISAAAKTSANNSANSSAHRSASQSQLSRRIYRGRQY